MPSRRHHARHKWALVTVTALGIVTLGLTGFALVNQEAAAPSAYTPPTLFASTRSAVPALKPVPAGSSVLIVGDSYTVGYGADSPDHGYAPILASAYGWNARIEGVGGTGYTWGGGSDGKAGKDYLARITALGTDKSLSPALVILEGSQNDYRADGSAVKKAVIQAVDDVRRPWPAAQIVVLGPVAPQPLGDNLRPTDDAVVQGAVSAGVPFVDGVTAGWFTAENSKRYAFSDGAHLNTAGYAYLADKTKAALDALFGVTK